MYDLQRSNLETILGYATDKNPLFTLQWGGRDYTISEIKGLHQQQKGTAVLYNFWASDGLNGFEVSLTSVKDI